MKSFIRVFISLFFITMTANPTFASGFLSNGASLFTQSNAVSAADPEQAFLFSQEMSDDNKLTLKWSIQQDYYLYNDKISFEVDSGVEIIEESRSVPYKKDDPLFGLVDIHTFDLEIVLRLKNPSTSFTDVNFVVNYQGCWEGGICYPPMDKNLSLELQGEATAKLNQPGNDLDKFETQDSFADVLKNKQIYLILTVFFFAGLALSFTPCVFPMIPILSSIIIGQGKNVTVKRAFLLSLIYVLSVAVTYTAAGILAGLFGENLQILFQSPIVISVFALIFVLLALSMFGFYELQLPNRLQSRLAVMSNGQKGGTVAGTAIMGVLSALIVGPCMAAPLAGALIYIGQVGDPILGGLALFSLSLGMGLPLLAIGVSAGHFLPKIGAWMESIKSAFGVILLIMAIFFLDRILPRSITMVLVSVVLIGTAIFAGIFSGASVSKTKKMKQLVGLVLGIYGSSLLIGALSGNTSFTTPLKQELRYSLNSAAKKEIEIIRVVSLPELNVQLEIANKSQSPVVMDFYADWCVSCREIDVLFEDASVIEKLKRFRVIKVDLTEYDSNSKELMEKYQVIGPPALVFYDKNGNLKGEMKVSGIPSKERLITILESVNKVSP